MRCALILVQTNAIKKRFQNRQAVRWFPEYPRHPGIRRGPEKRRAAPDLRFSVVDGEGLREAVEACRDLPSGCCLNVYGPTMANTDLSVFDGQDKAVYRGVLRRGEVAGALERHDLLVLPTYWDVEGYPGIVLEALQCGRPVISTVDEAQIFVGERDSRSKLDQPGAVADTYWGSVPEVVEDGKSGLLVEPRSTAAVRDAIRRVIGALAALPITVDLKLTALEGFAAAHHRRRAGGVLEALVKQGAPMARRRRALWVGGGGELRTGPCDRAVGRRRPPASGPCRARQWLNRRASVRSGRSSRWPQRRSGACCSRVIPSSSKMPA